MNKSLKGKKFLIVYAHPEPKSMSGSIKNSIVASLQEEGAIVTISDLYAMDFNPVVYPDQFSKRANPDFFQVVPEQRNAFAKGQLPQDIKAETDKVSSADYIITVSPFWWCSVPAILKGWFDRVLIAGVAWDYTHMFANGLGKGKRVLNVLCVGGVEEQYRQDGVHVQEVPEILGHLTSAFQFCGYDVLKSKIYHAVTQRTEEQRKDYIKDIADFVKKIDSQPLIPQLGSGH